MYTRLLVRDIYLVFVVFSENYSTRNYYKYIQKTFVWRHLLFFCSNKRPMGRITHMRYEFKSMNAFERSYDYIYYKTGPEVQEEKIFTFRENTFAICYHLPK